MRWPIRRRLVGGIEGRQACAAGIGFSQSPGGQAQRAGPQAGGVSDGSRPVETPAVARCAARQRARQHRGTPSKQHPRVGAVTKIDRIDTGYINSNPLRYENGRNSRSSLDSRVRTSPPTAMANGRPSATGRGGGRPLARSALENIGTYAGRRRMAEACGPFPALIADTREAKRVSCLRESPAQHFSFRQVQRVECVGRLIGEKA